MRKLLLTSSALVAAASISSYAVADVSVTGGFEWAYKSTSSGVTTSDGDSFTTDNEIAISFSNKTDTGLTIGGKVELDVDTTNTGGGNTVNDESVFTIHFYSLNYFFHMFFFDQLGLTVYFCNSNLLA